MSDIQIFIAAFFFMSILIVLAVATWPENPFYKLRRKKSEILRKQTNNIKEEEY